MPAPSSEKLRVGMRVTGIVQGVGFRPAVYRLATRSGLSGLVRNEHGAVWLEVEGAATAIERFVRELRSGPTPLARIETLDKVPLEPLGEEGFAIGASASDAATPSGSLPPDLGPCAMCLAEIEDPAERRHRHAFTSCTDCGPRFTIATGLPWDRARTTMAGFPLCTACAEEYEKSMYRRFHAETIACLSCGPRLRFRGVETDEEGMRALDAAVAALGSGAIVAVKGVGGYLLAADARCEEAIARLRSRKRRPEKPFAVMVRDEAQAWAIARLGDAEWKALRSQRRPIVLAARQREALLAPSVAPGLATIGLFLPPSPLQHLLAREGPPLLVMTSGNRSDEPIAIDDREALDRLGPIADAFLLHDRPIHRRADDSVERVIGRKPVVLRRARGHVPEPIALPFTSAPILAVGGAAKIAVCLAFGEQAILSTHIGEVSHPQALAAFVGAIEELQRQEGVRPQVVAHDLHPDYPSSRWAAECGLRAIAVQHHHAHLAACLAENRRDEKVIGVIFDGAGLGTDGTSWGGEFLVGDFSSFERVAHLRPLRLPGGDAAIRAPWRIGLAALFDAGAEVEPLADEKILDLLGRDLATPKATGAGRYFDAVAAICGLCRESTWEGQAAALLESAAGSVDAPAYPFELQEGLVDLLPTIRAIAADRRKGVAVEEIAAGFHETLALATATHCAELRRRGAPGVVALSGGCFQNRRLSERVEALLVERDFEVLRHRLVPPGDGGLALGQALVAARRIEIEGGA